MEKAVAPHSSTLAWKIPWTQEPARLQSMGLLRVGHNWATSLHFSLSCIGEGNGNPLQCSCLENPRDGGAWWAAICGVAQSWTRLKQLGGSIGAGVYFWAFSVVALVCISVFVPVFLFFLFVFPQIQSGHQYLTHAMQDSYEDKIKVWG